MTSAHPPAEHNPHVHAEALAAEQVLVTQRRLAEQPEPPAIGPVETNADQVTTDHDEVTTTPPGSTDTEPDAGAVAGSPTIPAPDAEGGEQPSAAQPETEEPAGTDSSASSSQDGISGENSENAIPSPAPSAENPSRRAGKTGKSTAGGGTGTGTGR